MDFNSLLKGALPSLGGNMTAVLGHNSSRRSLPEGVAHLLPLLGSRSNPLVQMIIVAYDMLDNRLGLDPTVVLTAFGFLWAFNKVWRQVYAFVFALVNSYLVASISISSGDDIYVHMMRWLALQPHMANSRSLMAETVGTTAWEDEDEMDVLKTRISADGSGVYLNFSNQEAKAPPRFIPAMGMHSFWFRGTFFRLHRKREAFVQEDISTGVQALKDKENIVISCYGWSPDPIKGLLQHTKEQYYADHYARTIVKRPSPQNIRRYGSRHAWVQVANRPVRPMKTVVLGAKQKVQVLTDINEYLHPATPRWYANRGIPLRRGYLFHGPPGTGKTSLSFALAGVFGLDIYVISLMEPALTEEDLLSLFNTLPRRCVVLLEDIDTAGLGRPGDKPDDATDDAKSADDKEKLPPNEWRVSDLARALKKDGGDSAEKKGISLSGLLNAIDGVASHEGRVLIMTTNHPEALDDALIRPGRVDLQVAFGNATREQVLELFERMYEADHSNKAHHRKQQPAVANGSAVPSSPDGKDGHADRQSTLSTTAAELRDVRRLDMGIAELRDIATEFANSVPDAAFSPAEIQGFLLRRKKNPRKALDEVGSWVEHTMDQRAKKTKVLLVQ